MHSPITVPLHTKITVSLPLAMAQIFGHAMTYDRAAWRWYCVLGVLRGQNSFLAFLEMLVYTIK